jgi:hypothetical protein
LPDDARLVQVRLRQLAVNGPLNPWRHPWFLEGLTWLYLIWSLAPIAIAVLFSFNKGRVPRLPLRDPRRAREQARRPHHDRRERRLTVSFF